MGLAIVLTALLCVYFMRDVQLLATPRRRKSLWKRLAVYGVFQIVYVAFLAAILRPIAIVKPLRMFQTSPYWICAVLLHGLIWVFCARLDQRGNASRCWLASVLPAPVLLVSISTVPLFLPQAIQSIGAVPRAVLIAGAWWMAIALSSSVVASQSGAVEAGFAIQFASMANTTALILVPIAQIVQGLL